MQIIHIMGAKGSGKSTLAHHLAVTAYPMSAVVIDDHAPGQHERDKDLMPRRIFERPLESGFDAFCERVIRGRKRNQCTLILVGDHIVNALFAHRYGPFCDGPMVEIRLDTRFQRNDPAVSSQEQNHG